MEKEFILDDLLRKVDTKKLNIKKSEILNYPTGAADLPARTATTVNQGLSCYVPRDGATVINNAISVSANGDYCAFWQDTDFTILQDSYALVGKNHTLRREEALYIIGAMNRAFAGKYNWNNKSGWNKLRHEKIMLPALSDDSPDWQYMQERITELEQERITELEQYLIATGLNDYELADEDRAILALSRKATPDKTGDHADAGGKREEEFLIRDMFTSANGNVDIQKTDINDCGIHVVSSGVSNCGIIGKTDREAAVFPANTITVDMFGYAFYRDFDYKMVTHARVFTLLPKKNISALSQIYIVTQLSSLPKMYNYSNMCSWNKIQNMPISLPIKIDSAGSPVLDPDCTYHPAGYIPNWDYMDKYIRAVEKLVIADVVKWKDEEIARTKEIVNKGT